MGNKKLISVLCAASIISASMAALSVQAADDLWSYDGTGTTGWSIENGTVTNETDDLGDYLKLAGGGSGNRVGTYSIGQAISGQYVIEFDTALTRGNGMARLMHSTQLAFTNDTGTMDTRFDAGVAEEVNANQGTGYKTDSGAGSSIANAALKIDLRPYLTNKWIINDDSTAALTAYPESAVEITDGTWVRVQAAVDGNTTTVNVIDNAGNKLVDNVSYTNTLNAISSIYVVCNRGDGAAGTISLDNMHIYQGAPEALTTTDLRGEAAKPADPPTLAPEPAAELAPVITAHASAESLYEQNFDGVEVGSGLTMSSSAQETYTGIEGLTVDIGSRDGDTMTKAVVENNLPGDNIMNITAGQYSTKGRLARVGLADNLDISSDTTKTSIMAFAFNLRASKAGGHGSLYLLDNTTNVDGNGVARDVLAVFTTEEDASGYANGDTAIGVSVTADEWHTAAVAVSSGKYRVYLDGDYENPIVQGEKVNTGATAVQVTHLPLFAASNANETSPYSRVKLDNIVAYQVSATFEKKLLPTVTVPEQPVVDPVITISDDMLTATSDIASDTAVIIKASYASDGRLTNAETIKGVVAGDNALAWKNTPVDGDKVMALSSLSNIKSLLKIEVGE